MKITTQSIVVFSFLLFSLQGFSQTLEQRKEITKDYDLGKLNELKNEYAREYAENHAKALEMARLKGWPLRIEKKDGGFSELQGISESGFPIYYTTENSGLAVTSRVNQIQPGGALGLSLTGLDMIAGVWDGDHPLVTHSDFDDRILEYDGTSPSAYHASHVTGTIISSGAHSATGRGMAYQASVWASNWNSDLSEMTAAAADGLLISNHSYGLDAGSGNNFPEAWFGSYITESKQLDNLMVSAPYYQVVVAAGNDRNPGSQQINPEKFGHDLITKWGTSKNAIVVAAVNSVLNYTSASSVTMSDFSSWGPTDDNRVKPDICTKGVNVNSTTNQSNTGYGVLSGTSMASPGVTGALLLLQQHYSNLNDGTFMRAATLRGLMIHTADEAGSFPGPDSKFGWGLINAAKAATAISNVSAQKSIISELSMSNAAGVYTKTVTSDGTSPLIATICWTDRSGTANNTQIDLATPVLVNDLDIRITKDNTTYFPWRLNEIVDEPSEQADNSVDNVEKIEVPNASGTYTITVTHKENLVGNTQNYSLIVTGINQTLGTDISDFKSFSLWPNPATDAVNIAIGSEDIGTEIYATLYDIQGKRISEHKLDSGSGQINTSALAAGMYFVKIIQGDKQAVRKFFKKN